MMNSSQIPLERLARDELRRIYEALDSLNQRPTFMGAYESDDQAFPFFVSQSPDELAYLIALGRFSGVLFTHHGASEVIGHVSKGELDFRITSELMPFEDYSHLWERESPGRLISLVTRSDAEILAYSGSVIIRNNGVKKVPSKETTCDAIIYRPTTLFEANFDPKGPKLFRFLE